MLTVARFPRAPIRSATAGSSACPTSTTSRTGPYRRVIEQAAAQLRQQAILATYAGHEHKHLAFALALVLDELARHLRDLDEELRGRILDGSASVQ